MKNITNFTQENALTLLNSDEDFPVDFELAWKWLNFSRKDNAKESLLRCEFEAGKDFLLLRSEPEQNEVEGEMPKKGRRKGEQMENIWLTTECFKSWGMMATGGKGREVRKYFLECERSLKAIKANPIKKDFVLADVLEHDMLAAAVMGLSKTFSSLAEEKGLERTTGGMVNYADIAYAPLVTS
jgi:phage anti-repressor protein